MCINLCTIIITRHFWERNETFRVVQHSTRASTAAAPRHCRHSEVIYYSSALIHSWNRAYKGAVHRLPLFSITLLLGRYSYHFTFVVVRFSWRGLFMLHFSWFCASPIFLLHFFAWFTVRITYFFVLLLVNLFTVFTLCFALFERIKFVSFILFSTVFFLFSFTWQ